MSGTKVIPTFVAPQNSAICAQNVFFSYNPKTKDKTYALQDVSLDIKKGEFVAIVGHTGSGKSTFLQHLNGLVRLQQGQMSVCDMDLSQKKVDLKALRRSVGMVFQYPEYQLFADTVFEDVCFGPKNFGVEKEKFEQLAKNALQLVGLDFDEVKNKSPFDLSGGEKRRVALAGVLVSEPQVLVLDEPTAGLDPQGKSEILNLVKNLNRQRGVTVIMVSHDMNEVYENASRVVVFREGKVACDDTPKNIFRNEEFIVGCDLEVPYMAAFCNELERNGFVVDDNAKTPDEVCAAVLRLKGGNGDA